ncbi:sperm flagellar protein 1 isoform X2 [Monodelphis domestica]|uniref:sperm flagellar protein 1 isoform X2 n=2 Tax=Monodelphis domestica TaxID=13616 RepID=UPI0024E26BC9|nr:sperm flagellar protein 1 isoform X2 [Monodelphis domestica]
MEGDMDEEMLHQLYLWVDNIPLSRPKRNLSRDFSDGVLAAEVVKFYFPKMVEMHNYVPANSVQQKVNNWVHLNRKVLHKLNFSVPEDVIQKIAQCSPGVVELVLQPLRERLEERKRKRQGELGPQEGSSYMDMGFSQKNQTTVDAQKAGPLRAGKSLSTYSQTLQVEPNFLVQMAEKEQELLASQETVQVLQMKVRRLEHLLQLKNVRIDDLSRRLQQAQRKPRQKSHSLDPEPKARTSCLLPEAQGAGPTECTVGRPSTFPTFWEDVALALISNIWAPSAKVSNHLFLRQRETSSGSVSACDGPRQHSGKGGSCARLPYAQLSSKRNVSEQAFRRPGRQG